MFIATRECWLYTLFVSLSVNPDVTMDIDNIIIRSFFTMEYQYSMTYKFLSFPPVNQAIAIGMVNR